MPEAFPDLSELVPHADTMLLLDRVVRHDSSATVCSLDVAGSALFAEADGAVASWVGLEYMAQCAAVHGGLMARSRGEQPRPGLLLGSRRLQMHVAAFSAGQRLEVTARHHRGESALVAFDCEVRDALDDAVLLEGRVNLYLLDDWSQLGEVDG